ncbi:hypothetical protein GCM10007338_11180 [Corynebacterium pelargi]|nr:hypothetical protein GCM10007338_11180 [Corynebacterium pelargi]
MQPPHDDPSPSASVCCMNAYSTMRSHTTPIPTPPIVRVGSSALIGLGVALLTTGLDRGIQVFGMLICIAAGIMLIFSHPYRRKIKAFLENRNLHYTPKFTQILPLFLVWLALMLAPLVAPLPLIGSIACAVVVFGWMYLVFPHIDGSRALAFVDTHPQKR